MRRRAIIIGLLVLIVGAALLFRYLNAGRHSDRIPVTGTIEVTEVDVHSEVMGRIVRLPVDEGDRVEKGILIAELDEKQLAARVRLAEAEVITARARLRDLEAGARTPEIRRAEAALQEALANLKKAEEDLKRIEPLFREKVASPQDYDRAKANYDVAEARVRETEEALALVKAGARSGQIEQAWGELKRAEASLDLARLQLEDAKVQSPITGVVLIQYREEGEVVTAGTPIFTLGDLDHPWVTVYVKETDLGLVKLGLPARVTVDTYPGKFYRGRVIQISDEAEFTPKTIQTQEERVKLVFAVKVEVENENQELKPGMPADVELLLKEEAK